MNDDSEIPSHNSSLGNSLEENQKKAEKTRKERERKATKRKRDADKSTHNYIPFQCDPPKYLFYNPPENTVGHLMVQYLDNLQKNDMIARPTGWTNLFLDPSVRKKHGLSLTKSDTTKNPLDSHPWFHSNSNHYSLANTEAEFEIQMSNGLPLPVLILPETEFGRSISSQHSWSGLSLDELFQNIFLGNDLLLPVQDHSLLTLAEFTTTKTTELVKSRFSLEFEDRDCPWNCLEVDDRLPGFKGPKLLQNGGSLLQWQMKNPEITNLVRQNMDPILGGKFLDQWLLISEKNSGSIGHVDIAVATWVSCLIGKKTFWLRNTSMDNDLVWSEFDVNSDHHLFFEPWARIDLYPGSILIFPPGTIHSVYTDEDLVFCGGHFLTPQVMDRFIRVLGQTELDPTRTNDLKGVDFFRILENFILETILPHSTNLTKRQIHIFLLRFQKYIDSKPLMEKNQRDEREHLVRRVQFVKKAKKEKWIEKLQEKFDRMAW